VPTVKDLRIEARLTAFQLAAKADVSISSINRMEQGKRAVKRLIVTRVLYALSQELGRTLTPEDVDGLKIID
jgi:transcriptional regulator with XRE-family HTH domain